ncbi:MAG: glycosyltransferase family 2 protein [Wolbachia endosymbiont of Tyrophagus putrescentiae]|nr:glycosyltransferase family 2 protein [Wolbachia endosymbiont of Tyrophagus putrescentiae]
MPIFQVGNIGPDTSLCKESEKSFYYKLHLIPWQKLNNTIFFAVEHINTDVIAWVKLNYGTEYVLLTVDYDWILDSLNSYFSIAEFAGNYLYYKNPSLSAKDIKFGSRVYSAFIILVSALTLVEKYAYFALILIFIIGCSSSLFKLIAASCRTTNKRTDYDISDFPVYTILIPAFRESAVMPDLIESIENLDYPKSKLDVKLLIESDDEEMLKAVKKYALPQYFEVIVVPYSLPRTKAKACNYAMRFVKGKYLVIYDADDRADPLQLKKALIAFNKSDDKLACVQARLNYYNYNHNFITKFFSLEYVNWFCYLLPGLQAMNMPIPLGGSSNHFLVEALRKAFLWDAYNVTEDADLGLRLAQMGYKTKMIDSETLEESPITILAWIKQRARWIKGYMQTYVVRLKNTTGLKDILLVNLFVGSTAFIFFTAPFLLLSLTLTSLLREMFLYYFIVAYIANSILLVVAVKQQKMPFYFYIISILFPVYRILHSIASFLALWEFIIYPQKWNKTKHGLWKQNNQKV